MSYAHLLTRFQTLTHTRDAGVRYTPDELLTRLVEDLERLVPEGAAAFFRQDPASGLATRPAAGPRWRTAECETPAWLAPLTQRIVQAIRTPETLEASWDIEDDSTDMSRPVAFHKVPLVVHGHCWGTVLVLAPGQAQVDQAEHSWVIEAYVRHLTVALARLPSGGGPPIPADAPNRLARVD